MKFRALLRAHEGRARLVALASVAALALAGCSAADAGSDGGSDAKGGDSGTPSASASPTAKTVVHTNVDDGASDVPVDTAVTVNVQQGKITSVSAHYGKNASSKNTLEGALSDDGGDWKASDLLEPGKRYTVDVATEDNDGRTSTSTTTFRTQDLSLDQQAYASISPVGGATVGVAMPIIVRFDIPVTNRAAVERRLEVSSTPKVEGSWSWISDSEVHYRPKTYWPAGTKVTVDAHINGVRTAKGIFGQEDRKTSFQVTSKAVTSVVNVAAHKMTVKINGKVARVLPATTGKAGFATRDGQKVIMEKYTSKRMDARTTGIQPGDPDYYDISDVKYAMRVTNSGEFIHAAPWSTGSQGSANVSHGCTGLSTANAQWLFSISHIGDPVTFINSSRKVLEPGNGWTDWNVSYAQFKKGSAL